MSKESDETECVDPMDAMETLDPDVGMGCCCCPFFTVLGGVGTSGGSCFDTENDRMVSTPPLFRALDTKHVKFST